MNRRYRVDRIFPGVGRINLASGARTADEHAKRDVLLRELYDTGRLELLRAIKTRRLTITEVFSAQRAGRLGFVASDVAVKRPLWAALEAWIPHSAKAAASRDRYADSVAWLKRANVLGPGALVADLEAADWHALHARSAIGPAGWNRVRAMVSRFLTMTLRNKQHPLRLAIMNPDAFPRAEEPEGRVPEITPAVFWEIVAHVPAWLQPAYVAMVLTGAGPAEFLRLEATDLHPLTCSCTIRGTKLGRQGAQTVRVPKEGWPWLERAVPCPVGYDYLCRTWKAACRAAGHGELRLYDLRHAYGQWLSEAGVAEAAIGVGLRHRTATMTRRYTKQRDRGENARRLGLVLFGGGSSRRASRRAKKRPRAGAA